MFQIKLNLGWFQGETLLCLLTFGRIKRIGSNISLTLGPSWPEFLERASPPPPPPALVPWLQAPAARKCCY